MPHPAAQAIFHAIADWLENARTLSDDVCNYADTVLGGHDEKTLQAALSPENPDFETFVEFLLFPDERLLRELDTILHPDENTEMSAQAPVPAPVHFSADELAELTEQLEQAALNCILHLPEKAVIRFTAPPDLWRDTVRRLHLEKSLPSSLRSCIAQLQPSHTATATRLRIKAARVNLQGAAGTLLRHFLERYPANDPAYIPTLEFWLHFLSGLPQDIVYPQESADSATRENNPWYHLHKRHQRLKKALRQSQEFTERLQRFSMDLIMMQGAQAPFVHEDEAREQIRIMERVSLAVFGKAAGYGDEMREADYGVIDSSDITDVMRTLSLLDK